MSRFFVALIFLAILLAVVTKQPITAFGIALVLLGTFFLLHLLKKYLPGNSVSTLLLPKDSDTFAQNAATGTRGEVLISYKVYQTLHTRLKTSIGIISVSVAAILIGLKLVPVLAAALLFPVIGISIITALFAIYSLLSLAPTGQRISALKSLVRTDPRIAFARYAPTEDTGALKVGYTTYKKLYKGSVISVTALVVLIILGLGREIYLARMSADQNFRAAKEQLSAVIGSLQNNQTSFREELAKLASQTLQTAPTLDNTSIIQDIVDQVTENLPEPPTEIVKETQTVTERTVVETDTATSIQLDGSAQYLVKDNRGLTIFSFGAGNDVTLEESGEFNFAGDWYIDGTQVTADASNLNITSKLQNTNSGDEGTRYINTRAANFTNFSPSRDDVEAALSAIDVSLGTPYAGSVPITRTINGLELSANQTFAVATTGTDFTISSSGTTHTFSIPDASATARGLITTGTQGIAGAKTFSTAPTLSSMTLGSVLFAGTGGVVSQDNSNLFWDDTNNKLGVGTISPTARVEVHNANDTTQEPLHIYNDNGTIAFQFDTTSAGSGLLGINDSTGTRAVQIYATGSSYFTNSLGVGDTSPDDLLNISSAAAASGLAITSLGTDTDPYIKFELADGTPTFTMGVDDSDSDKFKISTTALGTSDRFVIDSSGYVGIGTASPAANLSIGTNAGTLITDGTLSVGTGGVNVYPNNQSNGYAMAIWNPASGANHGHGLLVKAGPSNYTDFVLRLQTGSGGEIMSVLSNGKVGIGTTGPVASLSVGTSSTSLLSDGTASVGALGVNVRPGNISSGYVMGIENPRSGAMAGHGLLVKAGYVGYTNYSLRVQNDDGTDRFAVLSGGNVGFSTTSFGTSAAKVLALGNGTAPSTSITDGIQLWAEDVAASSELRVRDEAGNTTTLSPHNFSLFTPAQDYYLPWAYTSERDNHAINVDMYGAIQQVELLSGKHFIYGKNLQTQEEFHPTKLTDAGILANLEARILKLETDTKPPLFDSPVTDGIAQSKPSVVEQASLTQEAFNLLLRDTLKLTTALHIYQDIIIDGNARVAGVLTLSKQQAGSISVPKTATEIAVVFKKAFSDTPHILVTPEGSFVSYAITKKSVTGFTIRLREPAKKKFTFAWIAMPLSGTDDSSVEITTQEDAPKQNADTHASEQDSKQSPEGESQETPTPVSSPTPTSTSLPTGQAGSGQATPVLTPTPTPSPEPSPEIPLEVSLPTGQAGLTPEP